MYFQVIGSLDRFNMAFVYITTNLINGKKYLGKHNGKVSNYLGSGTLLKKAIEKYGRKNFKLEKISEDLSEDEAFELEKKLSIDYNIAESSDWYNLKVGGEGFSSGELHPMYGVPKSEEHKRKLAKANIGKTQPLNQRIQHSISMCGSNNPMYGKKGKDHPSFGHKISDEHRKLLSEVNKGKPKSQKTKDKLSKSRTGKCMGLNNPMANPESVEKVRVSKIGRKRIYREDGSFYMSPNNVMVK